MTAPGWDTVRLFLHVLAATLWVGGQLVLAALVPTLRTAGREVTRAAAHRFAQVAWPAFAVLVATGIWNVVAERHDLHGARLATLWAKIGVVALSGATALVHQRARATRTLAVSGALTGLFALGALFLGVLLAG